MDREFKVLLGRILGETFRMQKHSNPSICHESDANIDGLITGIETVIDEYIHPIITEQEENILTETLEKYFDRPDDFHGYYTIENELKERGLDSRGTVWALLRNFKAEGRYLNLIEKMDSEHSPIELSKIPDVDV